MGEERVTEQQRRVLCELCEVVWHEETFDEEIGCYRCSCGMRFSIENQLRGHIQNDNEYSNRTFDNWQDYGKVIKVIQDEHWVEFGRWLYKNHNENFRLFYEDNTGELSITWDGLRWLLSPARCREVAEFIIERKEKE